MKLCVKNSCFKDKETGKNVEYEQVYAPININGMKYEVNVKLSKLERTIIVANLDNAELVTKLVNFENKETKEKVEYFQPIIKVALNGVIQEINVSLFKPEIYLVNLYNSLLTKDKK